MFRLFFCGGYQMFWPAPLNTPRLVIPLYYLRILLWTVMRAHRPRYMLWLVRWVVTIAVAVYLTLLVGAVLVVAAAHVGVWLA